MKIVIATTFFLPHKGGVENYVYQTAKRLVKKGHSVLVLTCRLKGMQEKEVIDGIKVLRLPCIELLRDRLAIPKSVAHMLSKLGKIDAIVTHTRFYSMSYQAGRWAKKADVPWLHIEHGTAQVKYKNPFIRIGAYLTDVTRGRWIMKHARVAGISKASCAFAQKVGANHCEVLYNGVDCSFFDGKRKNHEKPTVTFVGRLIEEKGVADLMQAMTDVDAKVIIAGSGPLENKFKHSKAYVGEKDAKGVRDILSETDVFVNPSYAEGLPTAVLEAGAMGCAVIASDVGGTREIIEDGMTGLLTEPGDIIGLRERIKKLLNNESERKKMAQKLQQKIREEFNWDKTVERLEQVLNEL